jgi:dihydrodipicolinate reductase
MSDAIKVAVNGAAGRMGQRIVALVHADHELELAAATLDGMRGRWQESGLSA